MHAIILLLLCKHPRHAIFTKSDCYFNYHPIYFSPSGAVINFFFITFANEFDIYAGAVFLVDAHFISFLFHTVWKKCVFMGIFVLKASFWSNIKKKYRPWIAISRLLLSSWQNKNKKEKKKKKFWQRFTYSMYRLLEKCPAALTSLSLQRFFVLSVSHLFVWLIWKSLCSGKKQQQIRQKDGGLALLLTMNMSRWGNTARYIPCCFPVPVTYLLWHPHHYPDFVLTW